MRASRKKQATDEGAEKKKSATKTGFVCLKHFPTGCKNLNVKVNMRYPDGSIPPPDVRLEYASGNALKAISQVKPAVHMNSKFRFQLNKWVKDAAHAVFELHPELREEGSLVRYFVGKEGRKKGLRGVVLTEFIEGEFNNGTWWKLVPESVIKGEPKPTS